MRRASFRPRCRGATQRWVSLLVLAFVCSLVTSMFWHAHRARHKMDAMQMAQFNALEAALELFRSEFAGYPPSDANDAAGLPYGGAMKMAEALMGQDLLGFHRSSLFRVDGLDPNTHVSLYPGYLSAENLKDRRGPYLQAENADAFRLVDIYGMGKTGPFAENTLVLCDTFSRMRPSGQKTGMPILYYRANPSGVSHDIDNPDDPLNIYSYKDNQALVSLGVPGEPEAVHPLAAPRRFYLNTRSDKITTAARPFRSDQYILISAGRDGLYGTADDICNFEWRYRER